MLTQASVATIKQSKISRSEKNYVVVIMRYYPRFLKKELRDEYITSLSPEKKWLDDFKKALKTEGDHHLAFKKIDYANRFQLNPEALDHLKHLTELARKKDVYLICQCQEGECCHRELLLLTAKKRFKAKIGKVYQSYPGFNG